MTYQNPFFTDQNPSNPLRIFAQTVNKPKTLPPASSPSSPQKPPIKPYTGFSLRARVALAAMVLSVIPVAAIGAVAYKVTKSHITRQVSQTQLERTHHLAQMLEEYIENRANEAETLAESPIFTDPNLVKKVTVSQKIAALDDFQDRTGFYDSIVYLDLQGNPLFQSKSKRPLRKKYSSQQYFQKAIASKQAVMNELGISPYTGEFTMEFAIPVKDAWRDEVIGVMHFRIPGIPGDRIKPLFTNYAIQDEHWHMINTKNIFFASAIENFLNQPVTNYYPQLQHAHAAKQMVTMLVDHPQISDKEQIVNYAPVKVSAINPELNLGVAIALDQDVALAPLKPLRWIFLSGTIGTAVLVGSIAWLLANRIIQPLLRLTYTVAQLSQGKLNTRIKLNRQDELAVLGNQINDMAEQLDISMQRQKTIARTSELLARMSQARSSRELQLPFSSFLTEIRNLIKSDRLIFYQFDEQWRGTVIAESLAQGFPRTLGVQFDDTCFAQEYVRKYQRGRIQAIADIHRANLTECHLQQLEPYGVQACLVLPVILDEQAREPERLIGLLIAHQCSGTRVWEQSDIDYLQQIAYQLAMVLRGYIYYKEENAQKARLQQEVAQVLSSMKEIAKGDLTLDLSSQVDQATDITKSFDAIVSNMRQTITQIQDPTQQIHRELEVNKNDLAGLKDKLRQQANQLVLIFVFIDQIANSITEVSTKVGLASRTVNSVVTEIELEQARFSQAIAFMSQLETSLRNNTKKS